MSGKEHKLIKGAEKKAVPGQESSEKKQEKEGGSFSRWFSSLFSDDPPPKPEPAALSSTKTSPAPSRSSPPPRPAYPEKSFQQDPLAGGFVDPSRSIFDWGKPKNPLPGGTVTPNPSIFGWGKPTRLPASGAYSITTTTQPSVLGDRSTSITLTQSSIPSGTITKLPVSEASPKPTISVPASLPQDIFSRTFTNVGQRVGVASNLVSFLDIKDALALRKVHKRAYEVFREGYYQRWLLTRIGPHLKALIKSDAKEKESAEAAYARHNNVKREFRGSSRPAEVRDPFLAQLAKKIVGHPQYYISYHVNEKELVRIRGSIPTEWDDFFYSSHMINFLKKYLKDHPFLLESMLLDERLWQYYQGYSAIYARSGLKILQAFFEPANFPDNQALIETHRVSIEERMLQMLEAQRKQGRFYEDASLEKKEEKKPQDQQRHLEKFSADTMVSSDNEEFYRQQLLEKVGPKLELLIKQGETACAAYQRHSKMLHRLNTVEIHTLSVLVARMRNYPGYHFHRIVSKADFARVFPTVCDLGNFVSCFPRYAAPIIDYVCDHPAELSAGKELFIHFFSHLTVDQFVRELSTDASVKGDFGLFSENDRKRLLKLIPNEPEVAGRGVWEPSIWWAFKQQYSDAAIDQILDYIFADGARVKRYFQSSYNIEPFVARPDRVQRILQFMLSDIQYCKVCFGDFGLKEMTRNPRLFALCEKQIIKTMLSKAPFFRHFISDSSHLVDVLSAFPAHSNHIMACLFANNKDFDRVFSNPWHWNNAVFAPWKQQIAERYAARQVEREKQEAKKEEHHLLPKKTLKEECELRIARTRLLKAELEKDDPSFVTFDADAPLPDGNYFVTRPPAPSMTASSTTTADLNNGWQNQPFAEIYQQAVIPSFWATPVTPSSPEPKQDSKEDAKTPRPDAKIVGEVQTLGVAVGSLDESDHLSTPSVTPPGSI
jgi:hypothetical protein